MVKPLICVTSQLFSIKENPKETRVSRSILRCAERMRGSKRGHHPGEGFTVLETLVCLSTSIDEPTLQ